MSIFSRIVITSCIVQFTFTTLHFLEMFHIISLAPLAPFYAFTDYLEEQYKRIEHPLMPLLCPLYWYVMLKMETHMRSRSKVINHAPMITIMGCLAQQVLSLYAIVFWGHWGKNWEEINWVLAMRDSVAYVLTNLGLVAMLKGWQWDGGFMDHWLVKVDAWAQRDRDARVNENLKKKCPESILESGLEEKTEQVEPVSV